MAVQFSSVQLLSRVWFFAAPCTAAHQASLSITNSWSLFKLISIKSVMPSNHLSLWRPLLRLPSIFPSIRVFSNGSVLYIRWPKYWSFSCSISPSKEQCEKEVGTHSSLLDWKIPWTSACQASLSITSSWSWLKLISIDLVMPSNHLILCHPFLLLPSIFPCIRVFSNESDLCIRWPPVLPVNIQDWFPLEWTGWISL